VPKRKVIVNIATSVDGYVARTNGNLDWLTTRPAPKGFYGLPKFSRSIDAKILGRKTFDLGMKLGASFSAEDVHYCSPAGRPLHPRLPASSSSGNRSGPLPNGSASKLARTSG
jgi:dihydrofolate reductase